MGSFINILRHKWKPIFTALLLYISWVLFLIFCKDDISEWQWLNSFFSSIDNKNAFFESYIASTLDSLGFFIIIGVITLIIGLTDPSQEALFQKINYIFPDTQRDTELAKYIQDEISSLACIVTDAKRSITVQELSPCKDYIKLDIKGRSHIKNIFNNHQFVSDNMIFTMGVDPVDFDDDLWGAIYDAAIICNVTKPANPNQSLDGTVILNKAKPSFTTRFPLNLDQNESVLYSTHGWCWQKQSNTLNFSMVRFTENVTYEITNELDEKIHFTVSSNKLQLNFSKKILNNIRSLLHNLKQSPEDEAKLSQLISPVNLKDKLIKKEYTLEAKSSIKIIFNDVIPSDKIHFDFRTEKELKEEKE